MKRILAATLLGALAGLSGTAAVLIAASPLLHYTTIVTVPSPAEILWFTVQSWGAGDLVQAFALGLYLRAKAARGASRGRVLALGMVAGLLLGLLHHLVILAWTEPELTLSDMVANAWYPIFAGASLAGGAALGLGGAWVLSRPSKEES